MSRTKLTLLVAFVLACIGLGLIVTWIGSGRPGATFFLASGWLMVVATGTFIFLSLRSAVLPIVGTLGAFAVALGWLVFALSADDLPFNVHTSGWVIGTLLVAATVSLFLYLAWRLGRTELESEAAPQAADLQLEKKILLKAIKEVEFDRALGKLTDDEAKALTANYRARAIVVLKALDHADSAPKTANDPKWIDEMIDRELRARMAIAGLLQGVQRRAAVVNARQQEQAADGTATDATRPDSAESATDSPANVEATYATADATAIAADARSEAVDTDDGASEEPSEAPALPEKNEASS